MTWHPHDDLPDDPPSLPGHELESTFWRGSYGDRPEPWQRTYQCSCGEDLGFDEEGGRYAHADEEFEKHLVEVSGPYGKAVEGVE